MKMFIQGEYVDLEKFHGFYWKDGYLCLYVHNKIGSSAHSTDWAINKIAMTKEAYVVMCNDVSRQFKISQFNLKV